MGQPAHHLSDSSPFVSPADYLRLERAAEFRHEYFRGDIQDMADASYAHNTICANLNG